ncbi:MAG: hypothetical protein IKY82_00720 [Alistipes sp.]|nr:hypothetical protein [Alistipes sp.]
MKWITKFSALGVVAALALVACQKDNVSYPKLQKGISITASTSSSVRTTFDGQATKWAAGDEMCVLIEGNNYSTPTPHLFTLTDAATNQFTNATAGVDYELEYDFYAVYSSDEVTINEGTTVTVQIGAATQTQAGSDPNHIAALDPLTGCTLATKPNEVGIEMNHNAAVLAVAIRNNAPMTGIQSLQIEAEEGITLYGKFDIDIADGAISGGIDTGRSVVVEVEDSGVVATDEEFIVYAAIAPCQLAANSTLKFTVTESNGTVYELVKEFPNGRTISAGDLLSTTLNMSAANTTTYNILFTSGNIPAGFPANDDDSVKDATTYFSFNGVTLGFNCKGGYSTSNTTDDYLIFNTTSKSGAMIVIPKLDGCTLAEATLLNDITGKHRASLYNADGIVKIVGGTGNPVDSKKLASDATILSPTTTADVDYIYVYNDSSTNPYRCQGLCLKYVKQ